MKYKTDAGQNADVFYISDVSPNKLAHGDVHLYVLDKKGDVHGQDKTAPGALAEDRPIEVGDYFVEIEGNIVGIYSEAELSEWTPVKGEEASSKPAENNDKKDVDDKDVADTQLGDEGDDSLDNLIDEEDPA